MQGYNLSLVLRTNRFCNLIFSLYSVYFASFDIFEPGFYYIAQDDLKPVIPLPQSPEITQVFVSCHGSKVYIIIL